MVNRHWNLITSGAIFEELATPLIFFEDPKAALFGRRGKDGGQDAHAGDGTRVFQAKHHEDGSAAKAIADAKKEAAKIVEYRKPGHALYAQWKGVTHWRLVANAPEWDQRGQFGAQDVRVYTGHGPSSHIVTATKVTTGTCSFFSLLPSWAICSICRITPAQKYSTINLQAEKHLNPLKILGLDVRKLLHRYFKPLP